MNKTTNRRTAVILGACLVIVLILAALAVIFIPKRNHDSSHRESMHHQSSPRAAELRSTIASKFQTKTIDGQQWIVGHAISMQVPDSWSLSTTEHISLDQSAYEGSAGLPADTEPLPAGVQFSMGIPGEGAQIDTLPEAARGVAEIAPKYNYLGSGKATIAGAQDAAYLRFERDLTLQNNKVVHVEQLSLFVEVKPGITSTIRFIASAGDWNNQMKRAYDSLSVTPADK